MGVLHQAAALDADEIPHAKALGLEVLPSGRSLFALPCPRLEGTVCGIYGQRPRVCGRYKCQLLQNFEAGVTAQEQAFSLVAEAKRLLQDVRALLPNGTNYNLARRQTLAAAPSPLGSDSLLRLKITSLEHLLDKFFRNARDLKILLSSNVEPNMENVDG